MTHSIQTSWPNFTERELRCKCGCNRTNPNPEWVPFMDKIQKLREIIGEQLPVSSAYRCPDHPIEAKKAKAGHHSHAAIDLQVSYGLAHRVITEGLKLGFTGLGVSQKGSGRFIHFDLRTTPTVWSY